MALSLWGFLKVIEMSDETKKGRIIEREIIMEMGGGSQ